MINADDRLPWRGPGPDRPRLPLPPGRMPLWRHGALRKRWRYVGVFGPELMICAAQVRIGPAGQRFWALWDRRRGRRYGDTTLRPGSGAVVIRGAELAIDSSDVRARLRLGDSEPIESICSSGRGWSWTRKRAGFRVTGTVETPAGSVDLEAKGVDDESAGYHRRHTSWRWSAGVGRAADGRAVAWNLVAGVNDPPHSSERAIWVDGSPWEPPPVAFDGLDGLATEAGDRLRFQAECERSRSDNFLLVRSRYRHLFGTFAGALPGARDGDRIGLADGLGVMEEHEAAW